MALWRKLRTVEYVFSVGWIESKKTYLEASEHEGEWELHKKDASISPVPQHPLVVSSKPVKIQLHISCGLLDGPWSWFNVGVLIHWWPTWVDLTCQLESIGLYIELITRNILPNNGLVTYDMLSNCEYHIIQVTTVFLLNHLGSLVWDLLW